MSKISVAKSGKRFNCPACGAEESVPEDSIIGQVSPSPFKEVIYMQGTCTVCRSTRTQWFADMDGNIISEQGDR